MSHCKYCKQLDPYSLQCNENRIEYFARCELECDHFELDYYRADSIVTKVQGRDTDLQDVNTVIVNGDVNGDIKDCKTVVVIGGNVNGKIKKCNTVGGYLANSQTMEEIKEVFDKFA